MKTITGVCGSDAIETISRRDIRIYANDSKLRTFSTIKLSNTAENRQCQYVENRRSNDEKTFSRVSRFAFHFARSNARQNTSNESAEYIASIAV